MDTINFYDNLMRGLNIKAIITSLLEKLLIILIFKIVVFRGLRDSTVPA